jgi:hypothetical protein
MQLRGLTLFLALCLAAGCTGAAGKIMADTTVPTAENPNAQLVPYVPPDIEELTGVPEGESGATGAVEGADPAAPPPEPTPAPAPAPTPEPKQ